MTGPKHKYAQLLPNLHNVSPPLVITRAKKFVGFKVKSRCRPDDGRMVCSHLNAVKVEAGCEVDRFVQ